MTTRYKVHCQPAFHPETVIEVLFDDEGEFVRVQGAGGTEQAPLSVEHGVAFLEAMESLAPDSIANGWQGGIDGCFFTCSVRTARSAVHTFSAWSPQPDKSPQQHAFISLVYWLAWDTVRESATIVLLEQFWGYISDALPARVLQEEPLRVRIFGRLSSTDSKALNELFTSVPPQVPVLVDMTNFEVMGTVLLPRFRHLHDRAGLTVWLVNESVDYYLRGAGISTERFHRELESAVAALQQ